jgi:hypothetical protein
MLEKYFSGQGQQLAMQSKIIEYFYWRKWRDIYTLSARTSF